MLIVNTFIFARVTSKEMRCASPTVNTDSDGNISIPVGRRRAPNSTHDGTLPTETFDATYSTHLFHNGEYESHQLPLGAQERHHVVGPIFSSGGVKRAAKASRPAGKQASRQAGKQASRQVRNEQAPRRTITLPLLTGERDA